MDRDALVAALAQSVPEPLAVDLTDSFLELRRDAATETLGRSAPGKFVESVVQVLQHLSTGQHELKPKVDDFLNNAENRATGLHEDLRICAARIARSMYTLRNKRNIAHKGQVDPNAYDLRYLMAGAQWIMAELIRQTQGLKMSEAGRLIDIVTAPVGGLVEDFGGKRLVHGELTVREEIVVLLHSYYPDAVAGATVSGQLDRRSAGGVRNELRRLWQEKLIEGGASTGYRLTRTGLERAIKVIERETESAA